MMPALHQAIFCVDIERFGARSRTDPDRVAMRAALYRYLAAAFARSEVGWDGCYREDRGDGALILVPASVPKDLLIGQVFEDFVAALDRHNRQARREDRFRARVVVHAGEIRRDDHGVVGSALNHAFRLLEADAAKSALRDSSASVVLIASDWFFEEVIRHTLRGGSGGYRPIRVAVKETHARAWLYLPGGSARQADADPAVVATAIPILPVPRQLPRAVPGFVGRDEELAALTRLLDDPDHGATVVISAVTGTAGVGKTALAVHWAHQVRERFSGGELYVNLRGYGPGQPVTSEQALDAVLRGLGMSGEKIPPGLDAKAAAYRSLLTGRRVLVLLDNAADAEQVRPLLPGSPGCVTAVTSRSRLAGLVAGDGARPVDLDRLAEADALRLVRQIIGAARVEAEPAAAVDIVQRCARLPLALRIAAERAAARPHVALAEVAADLADERRRLDVLDTGDASTAVRAVFSWSYHALPADLARVFRLLGLHPGPDICVEAVATLIDTTPAAARRYLDRLIGLHLLEETTHDHFRLHDLLRSYAAEAALNEETDGDRNAAERRLLGWYLHAATDIWKVFEIQPLDLLQPVAHLPYWPPALTTVGEAMEWCERESINLAELTRKAAEAGHHDLTWRIPVLAHRFYWLRKYWEYGIPMLTVALESARRIDDRNGESLALSGLALFHADLQQLPESRDCGEQALAIARKTGHRLGQGVALQVLALTYQRLRRFEESINCGQESLIIFREIGDRGNEGNALVQLGQAAVGLQRLTEAVEHFQTALTITDTTAYWFHGWAHNGLSYTYRRLGRYPEAIQHAEYALDLSHQLGDGWGHGEALYSLGRAQQHAGQHEAARHSLTRALTFFDDLHTPRADRVREHLHALGITHSRPGPAPPNSTA